MNIETIIKKLREKYNIEEDILKSFKYYIKNNNIWISTVEENIKVPYEQRRGLRIATILPNGEVKLSFIGSQFLGRFISKNVIEVNEKERESYIRGIEIPSRWDLKGQVVVKYKNVTLGTANITQEKLKPQIPSSRRIKKEF